ncbi:hypothetical protein BDV19DRAFT_394361 [Aspergillus venezuelensis]
MKSRQKQPPIISWRVGVAPSKRVKKAGPTRKEDLLEKDEASSAGKSITAVSTTAILQTHEALILRLGQPDIREITESLDPFCALPCLLTPEDRRLLHCYLLEIPPRAYGTRPDTVFSAVRDVSFPISLGSSLTIWWMLIAADGLFAVNGQRENVVFRKRRAYRLLNAHVKDCKGEINDDIMGGVIMAAITEARLLDPIACNAHLKGYEAAIHARGGLAASLSSCTIPALRLAHLVPYLVCPLLPTCVHVDEGEQVQHFSTFLLSKLRQKGSSQFSIDAPTQAEVCQPKDKVAGKVLLHSSLGPYLRPSNQEARFMDEAASFLSLFWIALTLSKPTESTYDSYLFASRVISIFQNSTAFDAETGLPCLTEQGLMWVVLKALLDFDSVVGSSNENELRAVVDGIDALQAYRAMISPSARVQVRMMLFQLLCGEDLAFHPS